MKQLMVILAVVAFLDDAAASDVVNISHRRVLQGGITAGDAPGYPATISRAGSYRLVSDLSVPDGVSGIELTTDSVTIDLNGYSIVGGIQCSYSATSRAVSCSGGSSASAEAAGITGHGADDVMVKNGSIRGIGRYGLNVAERARIEGVRSMWNTFGIATGDQAQIRDSQAVENFYGISTGGGSQVDACIASRNGQQGIRLGGGRVSSSIADGNGLTGIEATSGVLEGNTTNSNRIGAILTWGLIRGSTALANEFDGFRCSGRSSLRSTCNVVDNTASRNGGVGISSTPGSALSGNLLFDNALGAIAGPFVETGPNQCDGDLICP